MTDYLTMADALGIHAILFKKYGGSDGVRDMGALETALYRPQSGYYDDIIAEAAALMESLAINHPFVDGNKRVAFAATDVFLRINGYEIRSSPAETYRDMMGMFDANAFRFDRLDPWLRPVVRKA